MSFASLNGAAVLSCALVLPRTGAWHADIVVDAPASLSGALTLTVGDKTFACTLVRGGEAFGRGEARVVGGAGGLARTLAGQSYVGVPVRIPVGDLLAAAGERLADDADASALDTRLRAWTRFAGPASTQLLALANASRAAWRVRPDGAVWLGAETYPTAPITRYDVLAQALARGGVTIAGEDATRLLPGTTFAGRRVALVEHRIEAESLRTRAWFEDG